MIWKRMATALWKTTELCNHPRESKNAESKEAKFSTRSWGSGVRNWFKWEKINFFKVTSLQTLVCGPKHNKLLQLPFGTKHKLINQPNDKSIHKPRRKHANTVIWITDKRIWSSNDIMFKVWSIISKWYLNDLAVEYPEGWIKNLFCQISLSYKIYSFVICLNVGTTNNFSSFIGK